MGSETGGNHRVRIGAVTYLNAQPLTVCLGELAPQAEIVVDLPSRLADTLVAGRLDVAILPSIEYFRGPGRTIVSDACIACDGPVHSVKLYSRVPVEGIRTLALDIGSRTSAALVQILLRERYGLAPQIELLPVGTAVEQITTDAALLIGDRGMLPPPRGFAAVWDLGQQWAQWTGLPFVFALWIARPGIDLAGWDEIFAAARDEGLRRVPQIAEAQSRRLGVPANDCLVYLRDALRFNLGLRERRGLEMFYRLAVKHGLAPPGVDLVFYPSAVAR